MIQRVKIVKSEIEKLLDRVDSNWKAQILYEWQYGEEHPPEMATEKIYNLEEFNKIEKSPYTFYVKGKEFILEEYRDPFTDVLTNIELPTKDKWVYDPKKDIREVSINDLFKV